MKKLILILFALVLTVPSLYAAGTHTFGPQDLASSSTTVTGTNSTQAVTPAGLTARLSAPGSIGDITPGVGAFSILSASTVRPTAGSGTGLTVNDAGSLRTQVYKVTLAKTNFVTAGVTHDVLIATLPAKSIIHRVLANVSEAFVCGSVCTTATLSATLGVVTSGVEFLESFDLDAATGWFGDADSEIGSAIDVASATPGGYFSAGGTTMTMRATSGTGNWGSGAATNLSAGSVTFYILYSVLP